MRTLDAVQKRMVVDMITLEDCVAFSGLTEEEVLASPSTNICLKSQRSPLFSI
jgi:hypothetical protein